MTHIGEARWQQFILDECDSETVLVIEAHLADCSECRQRLAQERQLDEWLLDSIPAAVAGASERSLERFWETLDQEDRAKQTEIISADDGPQELHHRTSPTPDSHERIRSDTPWRRVALWWPAAAAAALLILARFLGDDPALPTGSGHESLSQQTEVRLPVEPSTGTATAEQQQELRSSPKRSASTTAGESQPLDLARLHQAQQRMAVVLITSRDREAQLTVEAERAGVFVQECSTGFASLRREGWPVGSLLRGWALGDDDELAQLALRYAAHDPATWNVLGAALAGAPQRLEPVLNLLARDSGPLESSVTLVRALERLATAGLRAGEQADAARSWRCAEILSRSSGLRARSASARLLDLATDLALGDHQSVAAGEQFLRLAALAPTPAAIPALLTVAQHPLREPAMRHAFLSRLGQSRGEVVGAVRAEFARRHPSETLLPWIEAGQMHELVPELLSRVELHQGDPSPLNTVVALGGGQAAAGLTTLCLEASAADQVQLLPRLREVLGRGPEVIQQLGSALALRGSDEAQQLSLLLAQDMGPPLLLACLAAQQGGDDVAGHQQALLVSLARCGSPADGRALLSWMDSRPHGDPILPLAWAAAAQLDTGLAQQAWAALGHDSRQLSQVSGPVARRFAASTVPSPNMLTPLRRALSADADS